MSVSHRSLRRSVFTLLYMLSGLCAAQTNQFLNLPKVQFTNGRVSSFVAGTLQYPPSFTDVLYVNAPVGSGTTTSVTVGELLNQGGPGFLNLNENHIVFTNVANVVAALTDFDGDGNTDYAFAITPAGSTATNLCVYYGTGATASSGTSSYAGPPGTPANAYPPIGGKNGCMTFALQPGGIPPYFSQIVAFPFQSTSSVQQLLIEDSANNFLYIFRGTGATGNGGALQGFTLINTIALAPADGAGPIYVGDFNGDGNTDIIVNGQAGLSASVYFGNGDGTFKSPVHAVSGHVHSMLMHDMDHDGHADMVVEGDNGVIQIFHGNSDGSFATTSEGGTPAGLDGFSGNGGHLAVIDPASLNILSTTPIGLSVLEGNGSLSYALKGIYNIGPGRSSFALADFYGSGTLDLAVDSPEGVATFLPDVSPDGGFQASNAYAALAPALGSVVGKFRNAATNPSGNLDVVVPTHPVQAQHLLSGLIVPTSPVQAQLLTGNGAGAFTALPAPADTSVPLGPPANLWSNLVSGDFNGDGNLDVAYSLTGLPLPGAGSGPGLYMQYGNGDGTFAAPFAVTPSLVGAPGGNTFYGESTVGDFNGDGIADIANIDAGYDDTLLGLRSGNPFAVGLNQPTSNTAFNQVAAGFFKVNRSNKQDLIFQQGVNFIPYLNSGNGTFNAKTVITGASAPLYPATVLLADVDGDGNGDLVVIYYNANANPVGAGPAAPNQLYIWYGNGDGTFSATPQVVTLSRNDYLGAVTDINGDGLPDLVLSDGSLITILYNQGGAGTPAKRTFGGEQHFLAGQGINSLSVVTLGGNGLPGLIVANGGATISNALALGGGTAASINLPVNPDVNTGGITVLVNNITTQPVTGTVVASPEPSNYGATFTLTATLTPVSGATAPTGTVTFSIDGSLTSCPAATLTPTVGTTSSATCVIAAGNTYAGGVHSLNAAYLGSNIYTATTLSGSHTIVGGTTTTTIYLCVGPTPACPSNGFVMPPFSSTLTMSYGQTWNGTWQITASDNGPLPGSFELFDVYNGIAGPPLCTVPNGSTACPPAVGVTVGTGVGVNVLTGVYTGDSTHTPSTSLPVTITVLQDTTGSATLTSSLNPAPAGQPVTFTATLTGNFAAPAGTVVFSQLNPATGLATPIGTGTFVPGSGFTSTATFTTSSLPIGNDSITASYATTTDFAAATFPTIIETITASLSGSFTVTVTPNPVSVGVGYGAILTVTVAPQNNFSQGVNLTCSNLPSEASCTFLNPTIAAGGGATTLIVQTTSPHTCGTTTPYFYGRVGKGPLASPFALPTLAGLALLIVPGRRRWLRALLAVVAVAAVTQISGCSTCTDLGTRPATYTFQVTGTASSSSTTQAQPVTMTVTI